MAVTVFTEARHPGDFIVSEANGFRSRENAKISASQTVKVGAVLGKVVTIADATSSAAADAGNTGSSGAMTLDVTTPVLAGAKNGVYRVVCVEPASDAGTFAVFDPDGVEIGKYVVGGAAFATQIKFTIADATDFVAGDAFSVTVGIESYADETFEVLDPAATDGSQIPAAIAIYPAVTGSGETKEIAVIRAMPKCAPRTCPGRRLTQPRRPPRSNRSPSSASSCANAHQPTNEGVDAHERRTENRQRAG